MRSKPFISAHEVAALIGVISVKSVKDRKGITRDLNRYPLAWKTTVTGERKPCLYGYDPDEVEALKERVRAHAQGEVQARAGHHKHLRLINRKKQARLR